eukprot:Gb_37691 [translate_table: standard]
MYAVALPWPFFKTSRRSLISGRMLRICISRSSMARRFCLQKSGPKIGKKSWICGSTVSKTSFRVSSTPEITSSASCFPKHIHSRMLKTVNRTFVITCTTPPLESASSFSLWISRSIAHSRIQLKSFTLVGFSISVTIFRRSARQREPYSAEFTVHLFSLKSIRVGVSGGRFANTAPFSMSASCASSGLVMIIIIRCPMRSINIEPNCSLRSLTTYMKGLPDMVTWKRLPTRGHPRGPGGSFGFFRSLLPNNKRRTTNVTIKIAKSCRFRPRSPLATNGILDSDDMFPMSAIGMVAEEFAVIEETQLHVDGI